MQTDGLRCLKPQSNMGYITFGFTPVVLPKLPLKQPILLDFTCRLNCPYGASGLEMTSELYPTSRKKPHGSSKITETTPHFAFGVWAMNLKAILTGFRI